MEPTNQSDWRFSADYQTIQTEILIIGGGPAGVTAAISAAQAGRQVLLIERYGFLGGNSTQVLDSFCGFFIQGSPPMKIIGGIPDKVIDALIERKSAMIRPSVYWKAGNVITYNPEVLKVVWESLAIHAGVRLLYHALVFDVVMEDEHIEGVIAAVKGGWLKILAGVVIDASGDADIAALSGSPVEVPSDKFPNQALTTTMRLSGVNCEAAFQTTKELLAEKMAEATKNGDFNLPIKGGSYSVTLLPGTVMANIVRITAPDPTDPFEMTQSEVEGRRQGLEVLAFLQARVPGFENAVLNNFSMQIGIRESRRIIGDYRLTQYDVLGSSRFADEIALAGWPVEVHGWDKQTHIKYLDGKQIYGIPYRCLLPQKVEGLIVAGRCLSADHDAHASVRVMGQCMAMGQAAGLAAHLSLQENNLPREVDVKVLRTELMKLGAILF
jgi:hypothetical protein